jgi:GNAT superfamily N-acetyltransferase
LSGILGHAIWHESNIDEHRPGVPRDEDDRELLRRPLGRKREFVELHELWLGRGHRGRGYGKRFFQFFERFVFEKGHDAIVYYAFDDAAAAICRRRGYKEAWGQRKLEEEHAGFYLDLRK